MPTTTPNSTYYSHDIHERILRYHELHNRAIAEYCLGNIELGNFYQINAYYYLKDIKLWRS